MRITFSPIAAHGLQFLRQPYRSNAAHAQRKATNSIVCIVLLSILFACGNEPEASRSATSEVAPSAPTDAFSATGPRSPAPARHDKSQKAPIEDPALRAAYIVARQAEVAKDPGYAFADASHYSTTLRAIGDSRLVTHRAISKGKDMQAELVDDGAVRLTPNGLAAQAAQQAFELKLTRWGAEGDLTDAPTISKRSSADNRIELARGPITEWYVNGPLGLEQGFTLTKLPQGSKGKQLVLELAVKGAAPKLDADGKTVSFVRNEGASIGGYSDLFVKDAKGQRLQASLRVTEGKIQIAVELSNAVFPIVIDPVVWLEAKLRPITAQNFAGDFSVSVSGDTALIGAPNANDQGIDPESAYVFVRTGDSWVQQSKLLANDGTAGDFFGSSVSLSGDTAIIGATGDDDKGDQSGSAYVFVRSGSSWVQQSKLLANDGTAGDFFGSSISLSGDTAVIGSPYDNAASGAAYVFVRAGSSWVQQSKLLANDGAAGDNFGWSVSLNGDTAVIGSPGDSDTAAYVFVRAGSSWVQQSKLRANDDTVYYHFGDSVSLSGDTAVIGSPYDNAASGAAYVFVRAGSSWVQQSKLLADGGATGDHFGLSVAVDGDTAIIRANREDNDGSSAYVFVRTGSTWVQQQKLLPSDAAFYTSISMSEGTAFVGAYRNAGNGELSSSAYVFARSGSTWALQQKILPGNSVVSNTFGQSISVSGDTAVIGDPGADDNGDSSGSAYVFVRSGTSWALQQKLLPDDGAAGDGFGLSVSVNGDTALIGTPYNSDNGDNSGSAYVFVRSDSTWTEQQKFLPSDSAMYDYFGLSVSVDGDTAIVAQYDAAYAFVRSGSTWTEQQKFLLDNTGEIDVSLSGDTAIVGVPNTTAYVFVRSGSTWTEQQRLLPSSGPLSYFGGSVSLSGDTAIVGASDIYGFSGGAAFVFVRSGTTWTEQQKLLPSDVAERDAFGWSVSVMGDIVLVGAPQNYASSGSAYLFVRSGSTWTPQTKLLPSSETEYQFGSSVSLSSDTAVVGAFGDGSAYVFRTLEAFPDGSPCASSVQCANGSCIDGVCCDTSDCRMEDCLSCAAYRKADGSPDGICGQAITGTSCGAAPLVCFSSTAYEHAPSCGANGQCQRNSSACADSYACVSYATYGWCAQDCRTDGDPTKLPDHTRCDDTHWCQSDGSCQPDKPGGEACRSDAECVSGQCPGGVCEKVQGEPCSAESECLTDLFCRDGFCCDLACSGSCEACNIPGSAGTCTAVANGEEPEHRCQPSDVECGAGQCNGVNREQCVFHAGTPCGVVTCDSETHATTGQLCNSSGTCKNDDAKSCGRYQCADATSCATSCTADGQCTTGSHCDFDINQCVANLSNGNLCDEDAQCVSNQCVDGYCCNSACDEQCEACDAAGHEGTCSAVAGAPHGVRPACSNTDPSCGGVCDGQKHDGCSFPSSATSCGQPSCSAGVAHPQVCNGQGGCIDGTTRNCAPFACNSDHDACSISCSSDADCSAGATCDVMAHECAFSNGICTDLRTLELPDGTRHACTPYICQDGACLRECLNNSECAADFACSAAQRCEPVPNSDAEGSDTGASSDNARSGGGDCNLSSARSSSSGTNGALFFTVLGLAASYRRIRRNGHGTRKITSKARVSIACLLLFPVLLACGSEQEAAQRAPITETPAATPKAAFAPIGARQPSFPKHSQIQKAQIEDPALRAAVVAARQAEVAKDPDYAFSEASQYSTTLRAIGDSRSVTHRAISKAKSMQTELVDDGALRIAPTGRADEVTEQAFELKLARWGRENALTEAPAITARAAIGNRIELQRGAITEWYVNGPLGLEQGFAISRAPEHPSSNLIIELGVEGAEPKLDASGKTVMFFRGEGVSVGGYSDLFVKDAKGQRLAARLEAVPGMIRISIEAKRAVFPIEIDPIVWVETKLVKIGDDPNGDQFGSSVSVSGDTALVGAPYDNDNGENSGSAYVFTRSGSTWALQQKLLPNDGAAYDYFGYSISVSGDTAIVGAYYSSAAYIFTRSGSNWALQQKLLPNEGEWNDLFGASVSVSGDTALVGAPYDSGGYINSGAAYVFIRSGSTWIEQQKLKLLPNNDNYDDQFGLSVSLGGDTAVIGAPYDNAAYVFTRSGSEWAQQQKLLPNDGTTGLFGWSVALSGDTVLVGAPYNDESYTDSGAAYVFVRFNSTWTKQQKLLPADGATDAGFGVSVSLSGDTGLIGAYNDASNSNPGFAYVFVRSNSTWVERQKFLSSNGAWNDRFGVSVSLSGDTIIIGASGELNGSYYSGSAYVFVRSGSEWTQQRKLLPNESLVEDEFGHSVSLSGDTAIIGAPWDDDNGYASGSAYVFVHSGSEWTQQTKLLADDGAEYNQFGSSVSVSGDTAVIGAPGDQDNGDNSGSAYVFVRSGSSWALQSKLLADDGAEYKWFAWSVSLSGDTAVIGALSDSGNSEASGSAYVFVRSGSSWAQQSKLLADDGTKADGFGSSVSLSGDTAIIGAPRDDDNGEASGSAYVFVRSGSSWARQSKLLADDGAETDGFGSSVSVSGDTAVIGADSDDDNGEASGSAYVFVRSGSEWTQQTKLLADDGAETDWFGTSVSVSGDTAVIGADGDDNNGEGSGSAYVFVRSGSEWTQQHKLLPITGAAFDRFGASISVSGDTVLVSAYVFRASEAFPNGSSCAASAYCASNHCVEGICCDEECSGSCESCVAWRKADNSADGTCGQAATGSACGPAPNACVSETTYALTPICDASGSCQAQAVECGNGLACVTSGNIGLCAADCRSGNPLSVNHTHCVDDHWCQSDGTCQPDKPGGEVCGNDAQCVSNQCVSSVCKKVQGDSCSAGSECLANLFCRDGYCCDLACSGSCEACNLPGSEGTCTAVANDEEPEHACQPSDVECGAGQCNGVDRKQCVFDAGTPCGVVTCDSQTHAITGQLCSSSGTCENDAAISCGRYQCADATSCATSCTANGQCTAGSHCDIDSHTCVANLGNGNACDEDAECSSNQCVDGYCCNSACDEQCEACDIADHEGTCTAIEGAPHGARPICAATDPTCGGVCDGQKRDGCSFPSLETSCGQPSCSAGVVHPQMCNGQGSCVDGTTKNCAPFACNGEHDACSSSCSSDADCSAGATCDVMAHECAFSDGICTDLRTLELPDGTRHVCAPYICQDGACLRKCLSNSECAVGFECSSEQRCEPVASSPDTDGGTSSSGSSNDESSNGTGGCSLVATTPVSSKSWLGISMAIAVATLRRRPSFRDPAMRRPC